MCYYGYARPAYFDSLNEANASDDADQRQEDYSDTAESTKTYPEGDTENQVMPQDANIA